MMNKTTTIGAFLAVPLITGGLVYLTPISNRDYTYYVLTSEALVMIPVENQEYADLASSLYLDPQGFNGTPTTLIVPEVIPGSSTLDQAMAVDEQDLVTAVENQFNAGGLDAANPLYIFGYSQSAVAASLAEQQLADYGIPSSDLHFVLLGDSASAHGGWLNAFVDSLPQWLQPSATETLTQFGLGEVLGATTPDNLYPTDVYTLSGDGWANWDNGANIPGMFIDHLEYLGLTPDEISSATLSFTDNLTDYYTIGSAGVDTLSALWSALMMGLSVF
jgi:hypothetical protein